MTTTQVTASTKFDYLLNCGFEELKVCHHPDIVIKKAYTFTSMKQSKEWNKITGMTLEQITNHRWNLVRSMLVNEGMTPFVKDWYSLQPTEVQELPVTRTDVYFGDSLMDHFKRDFEFPTLEDHYRTVLENMKREKVSTTSDRAAILKELLGRAFRVHSIYGAVGTLHFMLYVSAVIEPFPDGIELIDSLIDATSTPESKNWPTFYGNLRRIVTHRGLFTRRTEASKSNVEGESSTKSSPGKDKKVSWNTDREGDSPSDYNRGYLNKKRRFMGNRINALRSGEEEFADQDTNDEQQDCDNTNQSLFRSKMNALQMENQSLRNQVTELSSNSRQQQLDARFDAQQQKLDAYSQKLDNITSNMNALLQNQGGGSMPAQSYGGGSTPAGPSYGGGGGNRKKSRMNSNKPMDNRQQGGASNAMDHYGPKGGQQQQHHKDNRDSRKRPREDQVDRYLYNPKGHEVWKKWLRVCGNCGCYGAHFFKGCKGARRFNWTPNEDPRLVQPIEPYPASYQAAIARCKEEITTYGANRVRWNCLEHEAPTAAELV